MQPGEVRVASALCDCFLEFLQDDGQILRPNGT